MIDSFTRVISFIAAICLLAIPLRAEPITKETPIGPTAGLMIHSLAASPDGRHLAYATKPSKNRVKLMLDGKPLDGDYDGIADGGIVFSPDSQRVAFLAQAQGKWLVVLPGTPASAIHPYDTFAKGSLTFSADSQHWLVTADEAGKRLLLVDGQPGKAYDDVAHPHFSPDGKHTAYAARADTQWFAVIDSKESTPCDALFANSPLFSPDSSRTVFAAKNGEKWSILDETGKPRIVDAIAALAFSPDSKRFACAISRGGKWLVADNQTDGKNYDRIIDSSIVFSPDAGHLAYIAEQAGKFVAVIDGADSAAFDEIQGTPIFSADGHHTAFAARTGVDWSIILDGKPQGKFAKILSRPLLSSDAAHVAFVVTQANQVHIISDGNPGPAYDEILEGPLLSPDGKRLAYAARREKQQYAVIDGKESNAFDAVGRLAFSPDSRHIAFGGQSNVEVHIYLDAHPAPAIGGFIHGTPLVFDTPTSLNAMVFRGKELLSMHVAAEPGPAPQ